MASESKSAQFKAFADRCEREGECMLVSFGGVRLWVDERALRVYAALFELEERKQAANG